VGLQKKGPRNLNLRRKDREKSSTRGGECQQGVDLSYELQQTTSKKKDGGRNRLERGRDSSPRKKGRGKKKNQKKNKKG